MITKSRLKKRISDRKAWKEIGIELSSENFSYFKIPLTRKLVKFIFKYIPRILSIVIGKRILIYAYAEGSISSPILRKKLHNHPFPDICELGIYSDHSLVYHLGGGLEAAMDITTKATKFNQPFDNNSIVLDFGCGTSRILRYMVEFEPI